MKFQGTTCPYTSPSVMKEVKGEGMPIPDFHKKGNLYIKFNILFPKKLSEEAKTELRSLLQ